MLKTEGREKMSNDEIKFPKRMEIWYAELEDKKDSNIQSKSRPVLIFSNDLNNWYSSVATVLPMTRRPKRLDLPGHTLINREKLKGLYFDTMVLAEQITTIDQKQLIRRLGKIDDPDTIKQIEDSVAIQLGMSECRNNGEQPKTLYSLSDEGRIINKEI